MKSPHRIDELVIDLSFEAAGRRGVAAPDDETLRALVVDLMLPALDEALCAHPEDGMVWHIDSIEIDLGDISWSTLRSELPRKVKEAMVRALSKALHPDGASPEFVVTKVAKATLDTDAMERFLQDGSLPLHVSGGTALDPEALLESLLRDGAEDFVRRLKQSPMRFAYATRLAQQFSPRLLRDLLQRLVPSDLAQRYVGLTEQFDLQVRAEAGSSFTQRHDMRLVWEHVLLAALHEQPATGILTRQIGAAAAAAGQAPGLAAAAAHIESAWVIRLAQRTPNPLPRPAAAPISVPKLQAPRKRDAEQSIRPSGQAERAVAVAARSVAGTGAGAPIAMPADAVARGQAPVMGMASTAHAKASDMQESSRAAAVNIALEKDRAAAVVAREKDRAAAVVTRENDRAAAVLAHKSGRAVPSMPHETGRGLDNNMHQAGPAAAGAARDAAHAITGPAVIQAVAEAGKAGAVQHKEVERRQSLQARNAEEHSAEVRAAGRRTAEVPAAQGSAAEGHAAESHSAVDRAAEVYPVRHQSAESEFKARSQPSLPLPPASDESGIAPIALPSTAPTRFTREGLMRALVRGELHGRWDALLQNQPDLLLKVVHQIGQRDDLWPRVLAKLPDSQLHDITHLVAPVAASLLRPMLADDAFYDVVGGDAVNGDQVHWVQSVRMVAFSILFDAQARSTDARHFAHILLGKIGGAPRARYVQLAKAWSAALHGAGAARSLVAAVSALGKQSPVSIGASVSLPATALPRDLYDALVAGLDDARRDAGAEGLADALDIATGQDDAHLRQQLQRVRNGAIALGGERFSVEQLQNLITALLDSDGHVTGAGTVPRRAAGGSQSQSGPGPFRAAMLQEIAANAPHAVDERRYLALVLDQLVHGRVLDLESIIAQAATAGSAAARPHAPAASAAAHANAPAASAAPIAAMAVPTAGASENDTGISPAVPTAKDTSTTAPVGTSTIGGKEFDAATLRAAIANALASGSESAILTLAQTHGRQAGSAFSGDMAAMFGLINALVRADRISGGVDRSTMLGAIAQHARRIGANVIYFRNLLDDLIQGRLLDLDAVAARSTGIANEVRHAPLAEAPLSKPDLYQVLLDSLGTAVRAMGPGALSIELDRATAHGGPRLLQWLRQVRESAIVLGGERFSTVQLKNLIKVQIEGGDVPQGAQASAVAFRTSMLQAIEQHAGMVADHHRYHRMVLEQLVYGRLLDLAAITTRCNDEPLGRPAAEATAAPVAPSAGTPIAASSTSPLSGRSATAGVLAGEGKEHERQASEGQASENQRGATGAGERQASKVHSVDGQADPARTSMAGSSTAADATEASAVGTSAQIKAATAPTLHLAGAQLRTEIAAAFASSNESALATLAALLPPPVDGQTESETGPGTGSQFSAKVTALNRLVEAYVLAAQVEGTKRRNLMLDAIKAKANSSKNADAFLRIVLADLIAGQAVDLDAAFAKAAQVAAESAGATNAQGASDARFGSEGEARGRTAGTAHPVQNETNVAGVPRNSPDGEVTGAAGVPRVDDGKASESRKGAATSKAVKGTKERVAGLPNQRAEPSQLNESNQPAKPNQLIKPGQPAEPNQLTEQVRTLTSGEPTGQAEKPDQAVMQRHPAATGQDSAAVKLEVGDAAAGAATPVPASPFSSIPSDTSALRAASSTSPLPATPASAAPVSADEAATNANKSTNPIKGKARRSTEVVEAGAKSSPDVQHDSLPSGDAAAPVQDGLPTKSPLTTRSETEHPDATKADDVKRPVASASLSEAGTGSTGIAPIPKSASKLTPPVATPKSSSESTAPVVTPNSVSESTASATKPKPASESMATASPARSATGPATTSSSPKPASEPTVTSSMAITPPNAAGTVASPKSAPDAAATVATPGAALDAAASVSAPKSAHDPAATASTPKSAHDPAATASTPKSESEPTATASTPKPASEPTAIATTARSVPESVATPSTPTFASEPAATALTPKSGAESATAALMPKSGSEPTAAASTTTPVIEPAMAASTPQSGPEPAAAASSLKSAPEPATSASISKSAAAPVTKASAPNSVAKADASASTPPSVNDSAATASTPKASAEALAKPSAAQSTAEPAAHAPAEPTADIRLAGRSTPTGAPTADTSVPASASPGKPVPTTAAATGNAVRGPAFSAVPSAADAAATPERTVVMPQAPQYVAPPDAPVVVPGAGNADPVERLLQAFASGDFAELYMVWSQVLATEGEQLRLALLSLDHATVPWSEVADGFPQSVLDDVVALLSPQAALTLQAWIDDEVLNEIADDAALDVSVPQRKQRLRVAAMIHLLQLRDVPFDDSIFSAVLAEAMADSQPETVARLMAAWNGEGLPVPGEGPQAATLSRSQARAARAALAPVLAQLRQALLFGNDAALRPALKKLTPQQLLAVLPDLEESVAKVGSRPVLQSDGAPSRTYREQSGTAAVPSQSGAAPSQAKSKVPQPSAAPSQTGAAPLQAKGDLSQPGAAPVQPGVISSSDDRAGKPQGHIVRPNSGAPDQDGRASVPGTRDAGPDGHPATPVHRVTTPNEPVAAQPGQAATSRAPATTFNRHATTQGEPAVARVSGIAILQNLAAAMLRADARQDGHDRSKLGDAIAAQSSASAYPQHFMALVLDDLAHDRIVDLESIAALTAIAEEQRLSKAAKAPALIETILPGRAVPMRSHHAGWIERALAAHPPALRASLSALLHEADPSAMSVEALPQALVRKVVRVLAGAQADAMLRCALDVSQTFMEAYPDSRQDDVDAMQWQYLFVHLFELRRGIDTARLATGLSDYLLLRHARAPTERMKQLVQRRFGVEVTGEKARDQAKPAERIALPDAVPQEGESIYVGNAGQVLAAPYMPRLFAMLGMLEGGRFKSEEAAERAVHLMQLVVTGKTDAPEYQLGLNKILCGVGSGTPIVREIEATDQEKEIVEAMIKGMIAHWKAIGNTSVAGLRESFLQRPGSMYFKDDAWQLKVQAGAIDMLIDRLPWSFSVIKHPWMERSVHVTWR